MLSVVILTKNEEKRIEVCLESVKWADEIIILDTGSQDKTKDIAKRYTNKIFEANINDFAQIRNIGMEKAQGEWVLFIDADERVSDPLKKEIQEIIRDNQFSSLAISRINIIFGKKVKYGPFWPDWVIRLIKKSDFEGWFGSIHEQPKCKGRMGYSKNSLIHLTHRNIDQIVLKSLEWSKIDAKLRFDANHPKMTGWRFMRICLSEMFNQGILRRGFFNGTIGIMDSILQSFSLYISYVRLWEMQQSQPMEKAYEKFDKELLENNFKYS